MESRYVFCLDCARGSAYPVTHHAAGQACRRCGGTNIMPKPEDPVCETEESYGPGTIVVVTHDGRRFLYAGATPSDAVLDDLHDHGVHPAEIVCTVHIIDPLAGRL